MDRRRAAGALLALAACVACSSAAPTASNQTALELLDGSTEGCYYNFQHYGEGDRIMTNEPCLNCTCHNRMLMCYLKVCPFTKPIGQDCTIEKRADQCCPIVTCPDVPVDLLTTSSTSSPAEYGGTGVGKVDKYGCSINGKYFPEGSKVPPSPNKPCEHCYCIRNMTTCVMQECTLHVDGCTPIYHKDVCCPVRYSCDHQEDEMLLLDDMTTTVRPTPGFLLTTTTTSVTQVSQDCVHDDQIFADGALIKTEKACEHCYCMKGDIVCVVQECGTPMENEGKNCTSLPPRQGQCCPDTYICDGDEVISDVTAGTTYEDLTTLSPPRRAEGSGYRNEPDEPYTEMPTFEGSGEDQATTLDSSEMYTSQKQTPEIIDEVFAATEESLKPSLSTIEPDKDQNTVPDESEESTPSVYLENKTTQEQEPVTATQSSLPEATKDIGLKVTVSDYHHSTEADSTISIDDELIVTTESVHETKIEETKTTEAKPEIEKETTASFVHVPEVTTSQSYVEPSSSEPSTVYNQEKYTTLQSSETYQPHEETVSELTTPETPKDDTEEENKNNQEYHSTIASVDKEDVENTAISESFTTVKTEMFDTTSVNPVENEIDEDAPSPGRIPGEGDCLLNGITYKNNTNVPNINNCHSSCKCISSIVKCDPIICSPPPENMNNMNDCQPIYDTPDACCPTYVCHSRETMPPESHSQMSGTESPKQPSEKPESQCHGEQCQSEGTSPALCDSEECQTQEQVKDSEKEPPLVHPEPCVGDNCLSVDPTCIGEKCEQQTPTEHICNSENGCQPSEAEPCEGVGCGSGASIPVGEKPCHDKDGCKADDTSETSKPPCEGDAKCDPTAVNKNVIETECTEESCRRKEQSQGEQLPPSECKGSECEQPHKDGAIDLTTETSGKGDISEEPTTEKKITDISDIPDHTEPEMDHETQKVDIMVTEKHDAFEPSTEKYGDLTTLGSEKGAQEPYTETAEISDTELESTVTETSKNPEYEKDHTVTPESYGSVSEEQATQPVEQITKEISTEVPPPIEYSTELSEEEKIASERFTEATKSLATSTEKYIESHDIDKEHDKLEPPTEIPDVSMTTPRPPDSKEGTPEEYTTEQEIITQSPETYTTHTESESQDDNKISEPEIDIAITESSITTTHSDVSQKTEYHTVTENDVTKTIFSGVTEVPELTTEKSIPVEHPSQPQTTKLEETVTPQSNEPQSNDDVQTEETSSEKIETDIPSLETTSTDVLIHTSTEEKVHDTVLDKENAVTISVETQEHETSSETLEDYATKPSVTEQNLETQTQESVTSERGVTDQPQFEKESQTTVITEELTVQEISTENPEVTFTTSKLSTTKTVEEIGTSSAQDAHEESTNKIEDTIQEHTTEKLTVETENENILKTEEQESTSELVPQTPDSELQTTISSDQSHKDQEITTEYTKSEPSKEHSAESTSTPELFVTKLDKITTLSMDTGKETLETLSTRRVSENTVTETTESIKKTETEIPYKIPITFEPATEPNLIEETIDKTTVTSVIESEEKEGTKMPSADHKTDETLAATKPDIDETEKQSPIEQDNATPEDHVTERIDSYVSDDADKEIYKPTEHSDSYETKIEDGYTSIPELITQSQESETKLISEMQIEITTPSISIVNENKEHTEPPVSLVTKTEESVTPEETVKSEDDTTHITFDTTTKTSFREDVEINTQGALEVEPQKSTTQSAEAPLNEKEYDSKLTTGYPPKESVPESISTTLLDYTTTNIEDVHKEDVTSSPTAEDGNFVTQTVEKLAPTTKPQEDTTSIPINVISEAEMHEPNIMHESTTMTTRKEEIPTKSSDIFTPKPAVTDDDVMYTEYPEEKIKDHSTTIKTVTEAVTDDEDTQEHVTINAIPAVQENQHTEVPEFSTTKYVETSESVKDIVTKEVIPSKEEGDATSHDEDITTERHIYTENHTEELIDQEKSTNLPQSIDTENKLATPFYPTTIKEAELNEIDLTSTGVLSTESTVAHEEDHRRTSPPVKETIQSEQLTTEKDEAQFTEKETTEQPQVTKSDMTDSDNIEEISTHIPIKETITLAPPIQDSETEKDISLSQTTSSDQTPTVPVGYQEDHDITATDNIDKGITEVQYTTEKPTYQEQGEIKDVQTDQPPKDVTVKNEVFEKTTASESLIQVPVETEPVTIKPVETISQESETESAPQETDTEITVPIETETETVPKETDMVITKDSEETVPKQTEASVPEETSTEISPPKETEIDSVVPSKTENPVRETTEPTVSIESETRISEPIETETEKTIPKETEIIAPEVTESSVMEEPHKETEHDIEPESTTYHKILPSEISTTSQPIYITQDVSSSETTPYFVELQEHTNKIDEDVSSVIPLETSTTKSSDQTERGDQSLETITDKSTVVNEVQTVETITEKSEEGTLTPHEQSSTHLVTHPTPPSELEGIPGVTKTEQATEDITESSESPITSVPSISEEKISAITSEEQSATPTPTVSEISEDEKLTNADLEIETSTAKKDLSSETERVPDQDTMHETTVMEEGLLPAVTKASTTSAPIETTTRYSPVHDKVTKPQDKPFEPYPPTTASDLPKPSVTETQPTEEIPAPDFPTSGTSGYGQEPDYIEEDQAFGPGTCRYGGKVYVSAQQIPRDDPCDFCFCFRSDIICLQQSCPPPIQGCHEEPIQGFCCPRYECPVSMATTLNVTTTTTTTTTTLPPHFLPHAYKGAAQRRGCQIKGHTYKVGDVVRASSGPCLHCTCGGDGQMKCDPKACTPEPMLRQMIAAAVSAKRRR